MSGIVNTTGAVSGVIGTTVGTPTSKILQSIAGATYSTQALFTDCITT